MDRRASAVLFAVALVLSTAPMMASPTAAQDAVEDARETVEEETEDTPPPVVENCEPEGTDAPKPGWADQVSQPTEDGVEKSDHRVESFDGTNISVRVYEPASHDAPAPTIFVFSPYHATAGYYKEMEDAGIYDWADCVVPFYTERGYNVVLGDMRGTHNSEGCFAMGGPEDGKDGAAVVDWIANRSWSDGSVGMYGVSHVGMSQLLTALEDPDALDAIVPIAAPTQFYRYLYMNGAKYHLNTATPPSYASLVDAPPATDAGQPGYLERIATNGCESQEYMRQSAEFDGNFDAYWEARDYVTPADQYDVPVFLVHGLRDENVKTDHFQVLWEELATRDLPLKGYFTQHNHSEPDRPWWNLTALRWFDHWLKDRDTGMMAEPPVTIERSDGTLRETQEWPPADVGGESLYLHQGEATFSAPTTQNLASYTDVPSAPANVGNPPGNHLLYTSSPLQQDLAVTGPIEVELVAASDRDDTNFAVHVYERTEDGNRTSVTRGYMDAQHRNTLDHREPLVPGQVYTFSWELYPRSHVLQEGSVVEVMVASQDLCEPYLGGTAYASCGYTGIWTDGNAATNTVVEGPSSTRLVLPVEGG